MGLASKTQRLATKTQGRRIFFVAFVFFGSSTVICVMKKLIFHANTESSCGDH